ncbi:hypothetical protein, conserved [Entamoeba dispar SAW760]|uniref:Leucine rich repeat containing protein BspA family protein n=1 Tax=Entamoeba dispar (strain ATCC PRA-260 / SAW760) TaxID=370354 RepID=B0EAK0_ENTDS|nr:uncharacterized protein EDI_033370 [Entamoeba dispar SAW760]EDR28446.1 hypothetical protein, conserved [Entamoeba dispar SAW760]|eukprot:EDR28446.1 hypothetical protein, conserved [Entamoeba dispar SAW760]
MIINIKRIIYNNKINKRINGKRRIGYNEIMITSKYFNDIKDFINLEIGVKRFQGNMERFHFNPIPLNEYSRKLFPNIETFHNYNKYDEEFDDGRIFKEIIWYLVDYSTYLKEKEAGNICKNIEYTGDDRYKYGTTMPPEVKIIGNGCFSDCYKLTTINIPSSITSIGNLCFYRCSSLQSINIPSTIRLIGINCFYECSSLTNINIENVKYISEEKIIINEPILVSISIPEHLKMINGKNYIKEDINKFTIPSTITSIGCGCFYECSSLTTINIPSSITSIGGGCFWGCSSITTINIPSSIRLIGNNCFYECSSLQSINIPSSITSIGNDCFYKCSSLTTINIPSTITSFGRSCFYGCGCVEELTQNKRIPIECFDN